MSIDTRILENLLAREAIRDLAMLYSRGVDRKDAALLRTLYTEDAIDDHGDFFNGAAAEYISFLEKSFPHIRYSGHHICNHLIAVDGDEGDGEVYALAYHVVGDGKGGWIEDFMCVRYIDKYHKGSDDRWRFSKRVVEFDHRMQRPVQLPDAEVSISEDASFIELKMRLFARGARA